MRQNDSDSFDSFIVALLVSFLLWGAVVGATLAAVYVGGVR